MEMNTSKTKSYVVKHDQLNLTITIVVCDTIFEFRELTQTTKSDLNESVGTGFFVYKNTVTIWLKEVSLYNLNKTMNFALTEYFRKNKKQILASFPSVTIKKTLALFIANSTDKFFWLMQ